MRPRLHVLHSDVMKVACTAVRDFGLRDEAAEFIEASGLRDQLRELATLNSNALTEAESSGRPSIAILNRPELISNISRPTRTKILFVGLVSQPQQAAWRR